MRIVSLNELKPEMELAREIMDPDNGRVLLNVGAVGLSQYAERLRGIGIHYLYVKDALSADIVIPVTIKEAIRSSAEKALDTVYEKCEVDQQPEFLSVKNAVNKKYIIILHEPEVPEFVQKYMEKKGK